MVEPMNKPTPKKITLASLAASIGQLVELMKAGFTKTEKRFIENEKNIKGLKSHIDAKIEDLAAMTQRGLLDVEERVSDRMEKVETSNQRIERKLDSAIFRSEFDALEERVSRVEKETGIAS